MQDPIIYSTTRHYSQPPEISEKYKNFTQPKPIQNNLEKRTWDSETKSWKKKD